MKNREKKGFNKDYFNFLLNNNDLLNEIADLLIGKIICKYNIDFYCYEILRSLMKKKIIHILIINKDLITNFDIFLDFISKELTYENLEIAISNLRSMIIDESHVKFIYENFDTTVD
jgi:hypothetical protein